MIGTAPVIWFDQIDSTSEEAKRRAKGGDVSPVWIAAREQGGGRGRLGRRWLSPPGNLYVTVLFPEPGGAATALRHPFAAALAVADAIDALLPAPMTRLKWPNDALVSSRKIAGILTESGTQESVFWVAIGMGINVRIVPENTGQPATSVLEQGAEETIEPTDLLDRLRPALSSRIEQARTDFPATLSDWLDRAEGLGKPVEVGPPESRQQGVFEGLAEDGGLILRLHDGTRTTIRAGDVQLVKEA